MQVCLDWPTFNQPGTFHGATQRICLLLRATFASSQNWPPTQLLPCCYRANDLCMGHLLSVCCLLPTHLSNSVRSYQPPRHSLPSSSSAKSYMSPCLDTFRPSHGRISALLDPKHLNMEDILEAVLGYSPISPSKARKIHHLSHKPPEYWTPEERMLSGKYRTQWLREENKRAWRGGNPAILDRIWPIGPYWPNGGTLAGGAPARRDFRDAVGRMRYLDQAVSLLLGPFTEREGVHILNLPTTSSYEND